MSEIVCPVAEVARKSPHSPALLQGSDIMTYQDYNALVSATAGELIESGISEGRRIGILSGNTIEYPILLMALFRIGAVACPISTRWPEATIVDYLNTIGAGWLLGRSPAFTSNADVKVNPLHIPDIRRPGRKSRLVGQYATLSLSRHATIVATSGTAATPKAVLHTYGGHYYSALGSNQNIPVSPTDRWLLSLPLCHVGGLAILLRCALAGAAVVIPEEGEDLAGSLRRYPVSHLSVVDTQLQRLLWDQATWPVLERLSAVLVGGGPVAEGLVKKAHAMGLPLLTTYGLTEMASQVTTTAPGDSLERLLTSGRALSYRQVRIGDDSEILVKGETLFAGYVDGDTLTLPLDNDGWFRTGDVGVQDDAGCLTVKGRKDSMFVSGGENIHPEQIEAVLRQVDAVADALVVPVEDSEFGFRPVAFVRLVADTKTSKRELVQYLESVLPRFEVPKRFLAWPQVESGDLKPSRHHFADLLRSGNVTELT